MSALPGEEKENESDPSAAKWLLTCLPQTLGCLLFSFKWRQARPGCLHPCRWSRPGRLLLIASGNGTRCFQPRGTFTSSLRNNQWGRQTFSPCRPGPSSAGTLIGSAAPVWTGSSGGPLEPGGNVLGPNMADLGGAARGKKWEMLPSWAVMRWNVLGGPCGSFGFRVCWCVLRLVKALSFSHSSPSSRSLKLDWCCLPARSFWLSFLYSRRIWVFVFLFLWDLAGCCGYPPSPKTCSWDGLEAVKVSRWSVCPQMSCDLSFWWFGLRGSKQKTKFDGPLIPRLKTSSNLTPHERSPGMNDEGFYFWMGQRCISAFCPLT